VAAAAAKKKNVAAAQKERSPILCYFAFIARATSLLVKIYSAFDVPIFIFMFLQRL
jgi:hypothetical protein